MTLEWLFQIYLFSGGAVVTISSPAAAILVVLYFQIFSAGAPLFCN